MSRISAVKTMKAIRLGILGTGRMAHDFAVGLAEAEGIEAYAVGSRSRETAARFADEFSLSRAYSGYEKLASDADVDMIYVATPHSLHEELILMCLDAGKAVICEKPFTINAAQATNVIERARDKNLFLAEAMWSRHLPAYVRLRQLLDEGTIGNVQLMVAGGAFMPSYDPEFYLFKPELGGGVLLDAGVYLVSLASMIFGTPNTIRSVGSKHATGVDDHEAVLLEHDNGAIAMLYVSLRAKSSPDLTLYGDRGKIYVHAPVFAPSGITVSVHGTSDEVVEAPVDGNGYHYQVTEAARCIKEGKTESEIMPLAESLSVMETLDEIRKQLGVVYPMERLTP